MSLVIENAAFYDPEPEVENFQLSKNIEQILTQKGSVNVFLLSLDLQNMFLYVVGKFITFGQGVIKRVFFYPYSKKCNKKKHLFDDPTFIH